MKESPSCKLNRRAGLIILAVFAFGMLAAACGGSDNSTSSTASEAPKEGGASTEAKEGSTNNAKAGAVDVGTGSPIPLKVEDIKLAYVAAGLNVPLGVLSKELLEELTAEYGISLKTFDPQLDPARQFQLYETVVDSGNYNAIITLPLGGEQDCQILSEKAPAKGIVVAVTVNSICGREFESPAGNGLWSPGTLVTSGVSTNLQGLEAWASACEKETGGGEAIVLNGTAGTPNNQALTKGIENGSKVDIVANYATNYTREEALEKTSAGLLAHPGAHLIMSTYPPLTEGAIVALKSAGKTPGKDVKLCSFTGGTENMLNLVRSGELAVDTYVNYVWTTKNAFEAIIMAAEGKSVPRVIVPSTTGEITKAGVEPWPPAYTKATVEQFEPNGE